MLFGTHQIPNRAIGTVATAAALIVVGSECYFTVNPSDRAFVRLLGKPTTSVPYQPAPHFKWPFVTKVDTLQVSQTSLPLPEFRVVTIDNQPVDLKVDIQFKVPDSDVARLLYDMGSSGRGDIDQPIKDVVQDRVYRVFSSKNTNTISANREPIQEEAQKFVADALRNNFGIELVSLQIPKIAFSATFTESNALAVTAKNQAICEENQLKVVGYIADQRVHEAQGRRDQLIAQAEGEARATELQASANANAMVTKTNAAAKSLLTQADADRQASSLSGTGEARAAGDDRRVGWCECLCRDSAGGSAEEMVGCLSECPVSWRKGRRAASYGDGRDAWRGASSRSEISRS